MKKVIPFNLIIIFTMFMPIQAQEKQYEVMLGSGISHYIKPHIFANYSLGVGFSGNFGVHASEQVVVGLKLSYNRFAPDGQPGKTIASGGEVFVIEKLATIKHYLRSTNSVFNIFTTAGVGWGSRVTLDIRFRDGVHPVAFAPLSYSSLTATAGLGIVIKLKKAIRYAFIEGRFGWVPNVVSGTVFWPVQMGIVF